MMKNEWEQSTRNKREYYVEVLVNDIGKNPFRGDKMQNNCEKLYCDNKYSDHNFPHIF